MLSKVSIIIPSYNALPYIKETLDSVFNQSYKNIEVIIIDDGSTDDTFKYLTSLNIDNLVIKKNKKKGACSARNYGFELSTGDFIQYLDADDLLSSTKIEEQLKLLKAKDQCIAFCSTSHFFDRPEEGKVVDTEFMISTDKPSVFLLNLFGADGKNHSMVGQHAYLTPRKIIEKTGGWNEELVKDQDGEFFTRVLMASKGVYFTPRVFAYYRKHISGHNIANQKQRKHIVSQLQALDSKKQQLVKASETLAFKNAFALQYKIIAIDAYPEFKDISKQALNKSKELANVKFMPVLGGKVIETIKFILGWKSAKLFRLFLHHIRGRLHK